MVVEVTCEACRVNHPPPPAHFHSHRVHFVSSFYTHTHAYGWYPSPPPCPPVAEKGTEICCQKCPCLPFPKDKTHKSGSGVHFNKAAEINVRNRKTDFVLQYCNKIQKSNNNLIHGWSTFSPNLSRKIWGSKKTQDILKFVFMMIKATILLIRKQKADCNCCSITMVNLPDGQSWVCRTECPLASTANTGW